MTTENEMAALERQARENLTLSPKQLVSFLKQAMALRRNLKLRRKQQQKRQEQCMHSK